MPEEPRFLVLNSVVLSLSGSWFRNDYRKALSSALLFAELAVEKRGAETGASLSREACSAWQQGVWLASSLVEVGASRCVLIYKTAEQIGPPVASRLQLDNHGLLISNGHSDLSMGV